LFGFHRRNAMASLPAVTVSNRVPAKEQMMFGASGLGCLYADVPPEDANAVLDAVVAAGIMYVDSAPWYGAGLSESRVGDYYASKGLSPTISTKCGRIIKAVSEVSMDDENVEKGYFDGFRTEKYHANVPYTAYTAAGIRESFDQSCQRLKVDKIHCLRLHDAENEKRWQEVTEQGGIDEMLKLRAEGKINEVSMGMNSSEYLLKYIRKYPTGTFDNIMMAGCFNLIDQDGIELLQECQARGIKVTNVGIFASGALWGSTHYKYDGIPQEVADKIKAWKALSEKYGFKLPQVAMNFALLPDIVEMVAFGCKTPDKVQTNLDLLGQMVPVELWKEAKEAGLIAANVPIPA